VILPVRFASAEWETASPQPPEQAQGIFGTAALRSSELDMTSQWNRVLDRLPKLSAAISACAADPAQCSAPWMGAWVQARRLSTSLDRREQLRAVNRFFNRWPYKSDRAIYRASEYWAAPDEFMAYSGDCEDYAIAKFFALRELGFTNQELRIAVVYDNLRRTGHAVLAVYVEDDILILNNQTDTIASHARYNNFVPWYLVNETTLWTAAGPALSSLIPNLSVAGPSATASDATLRPNGKGVTLVGPTVAWRKLPLIVESGAKNVVLPSSMASEFGIGDANRSAARHQRTPGGTAAMIRRLAPAAVLNRDWITRSLSAARRAEADRLVAEQRQQATDPSRVLTPAPTATPAAAFRVQLGAFLTAENAPAVWRRLRVAQSDLLGGLRRRVQRADRGDRVFHLLQVGPLADTEAAKALCAALKARGVDCLVVKP
jgi:predicted transglutaminase-like cysteine proteinase